MNVKGFVKAVLNMLFIIVNNLYCCPTYLVWMLMLQPLLWTYPAAYWYIEGTLYRWLLLLISNWPWMSGYYIAEMGDDIRECMNEESLLLINHQSTADVFTVMESLQNKDTICSQMYWIMDYVFTFTNFGWVSRCHGDFFIQQGKAYRDTELVHLERHLREVYLPRGRRWIILFPEGGFLRKRLAKSQAFARKNNYPVLQHVTLPRIGAMYTIISTLSPPDITNNSNHHKTEAENRHLKWVIDVTIGYPEKRPLNVFNILWSNRSSLTTTLYYRKYPIHEVPKDHNKLLQWTYARYEEKERLLDTFYSTGRYEITRTCHSPGSTDDMIYPPRRVQLDNVKIWSLHVLFLASSVFHYHLISFLWNSLMSWF